MRVIASFNHKHSQMTNWYYYDSKGRKVGPATGEQLKAFAKNGKISPDTMVETEDGKTAPAGNVKGLTFAVATSIEPVRPEINPRTASAPVTKNPVTATIPPVTKTVPQSIPAPPAHNPKPQSKTPATGKKRYDIFISYRRVGGFEMAMLVADRLKKLGYRVFFDLETMQSGSFSKQIYGVIERCKDVVVIVSPDIFARAAELQRKHVASGAVTHCPPDPDDWVRLEIAHAFAWQKNVVPLFLRTATLPDPKELPADIAQLPTQHGCECSHEHFDAVIQRLQKILRTPYRGWSSIVSLTMGILGMLASLGPNTPLALLGVLMLVIGLFYGIRGMSGHKRGIAIAGTTISIIALVLVLFYIGFGAGGGYETIDPLTQSEELDRHGDFLTAKGDIGSAAEYYEESLEIWRRLIANETGESPFDADGKPREIRPKVTGVDPDSPASRHGIQEGDFYLDYDGIVFPTHTRFIDYRDKEHSDAPAKKIRVLRGSEILTFEIKPGRLGAQLIPAFVPALPNENKSDTDR